MGDFTRTGDIEHNVAVPGVKVGDVYRDRSMLQRPAGGFVNIVDVLPVDATKPTHVVIEDEFGKRERLPIDELRRRFQFRRAAR